MAYWKIDALFYRLQRIATSDFKRCIPKSVIILKCNWATPSEWVKYSTSSKVIKITWDGKSFVICDRLRRNFFEENQQPRKGFFFEISTLKVGQQIIQKCIPFFIKITDPFSGIQI